MFLEFARIGALQAQYTNMRNPVIFLLLGMVSIT